MNWDDLRVIAAVNRTGSYTRAARVLDVEETTVARRVNRLETSLGTALFEAKDGIRHPTESCRAVLHHLASMEQAAEQITAQLEHHERPRRNLRLNTVHAIANHFLTPALSDLLGAEPDLTLHLDTSDQVIDMARWHADFAIRLGRPRHGTFTMRKIGELRFLLVRPRHTPGSEIALAAYPEHLAETPEMQALFKLYPSRLSRLRTSDLTLIRRFVDSGTGVAILPDFMCEDLKGNPDLELRELTARREIWLLAQSHLRDDPLARRVSDWCASLFVRG